MRSDGATIPEDSTLEVEEKRAGHIKGGASIEIKPSFMKRPTISSALQKAFLTEEVANHEIVGLITYGERAGGTDFHGAQKAQRRVGDIQNRRHQKCERQKVSLAFCAHQDDGKKIRITVTGRTQRGVSITFAKDKGNDRRPETQRSRWTQRAR